MDIVHVLPDTVANQIAAGEVVQRPASVIKELLENSVDAHSTEINIVLREAGRELIQVIDNGCGMSPVDARMAFERHATSKISSANDLFALQTMGFRGEALASIAAVAEVELRTRRAEDETGISVRINGGRFVDQEVISCPVGANFSVRNLFYNIPARRKFLKSNQTELSNIITEIQHVALANPGVGFTLTHNDSVQFQLTAGSLKQRIAQLFSKTIGQSLLQVGVENELLTIKGFVCQPDTARKKGALQYFFVNDRFMKHPYFHKAVMESYNDLIPEGTQPNYFISLYVNPSTIDVNIHPTKTEIKFENEPARWHILMATVREALGKYNEIPTIDFDTADMPEIPAVGINTMPSGKFTEPSFMKNTGSSSYNPFRQNPNLSHWEEAYESFAKDELLPSRMSESTSMSTSIIDMTEEYALDEAQMFAEEPGQKRTLMQVANRYIASAEAGGLLLIDQYRAHVCILYDTYLSQLEKHKGVTQQELFPEVVDIAPADVPILESISGELSALGFELDSLGGGAYAVNGRPASLSTINTPIPALLNELIGVAKDETHKVTEQLNHKLALRMAQSQAIPYGKILTAEEMQQLVENFFALKSESKSMSTSVFTPDGKKVLTHLGIKDIEKLL